jgi:phosphoribulokinase
VLAIAGRIADRRARRLADLLWTLLPEARHLRANVGAYTDRKNARYMSHPLAPTQLLIAYHMLKAALGVVAV